MENYCILYEPDYYIIINDLKLNYYYYFDYDERSYDINMDFQHFHPFYEIMILLSPQAEHLIEGVPYDIKDGDMILLRPSVLHKSAYPEGPSSKRLIINFMLPKDMFQMKEHYQALMEPFEEKVPIFRFEPAVRKQLYGGLDEIYLMTKAPAFCNSPVDQLMIHMKLMQFLYSLCNLKDQNIYRTGPAANPSASKIYDITSYIHTHYQEELSLQSLAKTFYISPCYLSHQFKKVTNFTLTKYIQITRSQNAKYLLQTTDLNISTIAQQCGFQSFSQFNRIFRQEYDISPSQFRKTSGFTGMTVDLPHRT